MKTCKNLLFKTTKKTLQNILEIGGFKRMRPQPGNALQEGRDESEGLGNSSWAEINVLLLFSSSLLLRVLARGGPGVWPVGILGNHSWAEISVLFFSSLLFSSLLLLRVLARGEKGGLGYRPGGSN